MRSMRMPILHPTPHRSTPLSRSFLAQPVALLAPRISPRPFSASLPSLPTWDSLGFRKIPQSYPAESFYLSRTFIA